MSRRLTQTPALVIGMVLAIAVVLLATVLVSADARLWKPVLSTVVLGLAGAVVAARHPGNAVGWLLLASSLLFGCTALATQWVESGAVAGAAWAIWFVDRAGAVLVPLIVLGLVLLPDGHLPSPAWRRPVAAVVGLQVALVLVWCLIDGPAALPDADWPVDPSNPLGLLPAAWADPITRVADWVLQLPVLLGVVAMVVRWRRSDDRRRLTGLAVATGAFAVLVVLGHALWPAGAEALDLVAALLLAAALTVTVDGAATVEESPKVHAPELSEREREVLALVAQGLTNKQIAAALVISPITARNHVSRILTKLDLTNRTQAAAWAETRLRRP